VRRPELLRVDRRRARLRGHRRSRTSRARWSAWRRRRARRWVRRLRPRRRVVGSVRRRLLRPVVSVRRLRPRPPRVDSVRRLHLRDRLRLRVVSVRPPRRRLARDRLPRINSQAPSSRPREWPHRSSERRRAPAVDSARRLRVDRRPVVGSVHHLRQVEASVLRRLQVDSARRLRVDRRPAGSVLRRLQVEGSAHRLRQADRRRTAHRLRQVVVTIPTTPRVRSAARWDKPAAPWATRSGCRPAAA
jgi:hypothetical protein